MQSSARSYILSSAEADLAGLFCLNKEGFHFGLKKGSSLPLHVLCKKMELITWKQFGEKIHKTHFGSSLRQCKSYSWLVPHGYGDRQQKCVSFSVWTQAIRKKINCQRIHLYCHPRALSSFKVCSTELQFGQWHSSLQ